MCQGRGSQRACSEHKTIAANRTAQKRSQLHRTTSKTSPEIKGDCATWHHVFEGLGRLATLLADHWLLLAIAAGIAIWWLGSRVIELRVRDHRAGAHTGR